MSFKKFQLIDPDSIGSPELGHVYLGRDEIGLWEKYSNGESVYIITGGTTGAGTSGSSGKDGINGEFLGSSGTSGKDGLNGVDGTHGTSGKTGTHGTSGLSGTHGTAGSSATSGISGTHGTNGTSGTDGTSGLTGSSGTSGNGSSGTSGDGSSGTSGENGAYGAATRLWLFTNTEGNAYLDSYFYASGLTELSIINGIIINTVDFDNCNLDNWINSWNNGLLKIEKFGEPAIFGMYTGGNSQQVGNTYHITNLSVLNGYSGIDGLVENEKYLISFIKNGDGGGSSTSGTSGTGISGSSGTSGKDGEFLGSSGTSGSGPPGSSGTSGKEGTSGSSGTSLDYITDPLFIYDTGNTTLYVNNIIINSDLIISSLNTSGFIKTSGTTGLLYIDDSVPFGSSGTSGKDGEFLGSSGTSGSGSPGSSGTSGNTGTSGTSGSSGTSGTSGSSGTSGTSGKNGSSGTSGNTGTSGTSGTSGNTGTSGTSGSSGTSGTSGKNGSSGTSGKDGTSGLTGTSGTSGATGTSGKTGSSGTSGKDGSFLGSSGTSGTSNGSQSGLDWISFEFRDLDTATGQTYILDLLAFTGYTIDSIVLQGEIGTGQTTAYINEISIGGLANISFDSDISTYDATSDNIVVEDDMVKLIITSLAGNPNLLRGKLKITI